MEILNIDSIFWYIDDVERAKFLVQYIFFLLLFFFLLAEGYFRLKGNETYTAISSRHTQPFLGFSDFRNLQRKQNPEDYGYRMEGAGYRYSNENQLTGLQDRFPNLIEGGPANFSKLLQTKTNSVFVMGGSAALGDGHEDPENRFFIQIEQGLQDRFKNTNIKVIPAAIRAFVSTQERVLLDLHVLPSQPKVIIFLHGYNDLSNYLYFSRPGDPYNQSVEYSRTDSRLFRFNQILADWSAAYRRWFVSSYESKVHREAMEFGKNEDGVSRYMKSAAAIYLENLRWMADSCQLRKAVCFFVLQPRRAESFDPISQGYQEIRLHLQPQQVLNSHAFFWDAEEEFRSQTEKFVDSVHMNDSGQVDLAKRVVDFVVQRLPPGFWEK